MDQPLVLVVDDDFLVRINTAEIFEEAGFAVIEAGDAISALAVLQEERHIGLVCTDVHMPGELDGIDLAFHLWEHRPDMKVIVISGDDRKRQALPPAIPFLPKPFLSAHLVNLVRQELGAPA